MLDVNSTKKIISENIDLLENLVKSAEEKKFTLLKNKLQSLNEALEGVENFKKICFDHLSNGHYEKLKKLLFSNYFKNNFFHEDILFLKELINQAAEHGCVSIVIFVFSLNQGLLEPGSLAEKLMNHQDKEVIEQIISRFHINSPGYMDFSASIGAMVLMAKSEKRKGEGLPQVVVEEFRLEDFFGKLKVFISEHPSLSLKFQILITAMHWTCVEFEISVDHQRMFHLDSNGHTQFSHAVLRYAVWAFPEIEIFISSDQTHKMSTGCKVFALDNMIHLNGLHLSPKFLPRAYANIFEYSIDHIVKEEKFFYQKFKGTESVEKTFYYTTLPCYLFRSSQVIEGSIKK